MTAIVTTTIVAGILVGTLIGLRIGRAARQELQRRADAAEHEWQWADAARERAERELAAVRREQKRRVWSAWMDVN